MSGGGDKILKGNCPGGISYGIIVWGDVVQGGIFQRQLSGGKSPGVTVLRGISWEIVRVVVVQCRIIQGQLSGGVKVRGKLSWREFLGGQLSGGQLSRGN